jgi:hypothetical protein
VTLTANVSPSVAHFDGWGGACAGTATTTVVVMSASKTCTAQFSDVTTGGWVTLSEDIAASLVSDVRSTLALDANGLGYIGYLQMIGTQSRLSTRIEGPGFPPLGGFNSNNSDSSFSPQIAIDGQGRAVISFNSNLDANKLALRESGAFPLVSGRYNLGPAPATRPHMAIAGDTAVLAWIEAQQIAVRRFNLVTMEFDTGAFIPNLDNPFDLDLAVDSNGLAVIAWTDGVLGTRLHAIRETAPGTWTRLGGDIGDRPATGPMVLELGVHVDTSDVIRLVWVNGDTNWTLSGAFFDGTNWLALPGKPANMALAISAFPLRTLSVNRNRALFAFAYAWDTSAQGVESDVFVQQWVNGVLTQVGPTLSTRHPRVGHLSLAMNAPGNATVTQSQFTTADATYRLSVRRHMP